MYATHALRHGHRFVHDHDPLCLLPQLHIPVTTFVRGMVLEQVPLHLPFVFRDRHRAEGGMPVWQGWSVTITVTVTIAITSSW